jgi:ribonuclease G
MKGRRIFIEPLASGGIAAALMVDGQLEDLLIDPPTADPSPRPEAIYLAKAGRPMKGLGGLILELGGGERGLLRGGKLPDPGQSVMVQVSNWAEPGKATPLTDRPLLKGRTAILTPDAPGHNVARSIRDAEEAEHLRTLAARAMEGAEETLGLILRSAAAMAGEDAILGEIAALRADWARAEEAAQQGKPGCLRPAPDAGDQGWRDWFSPGTDLVEGDRAIADAGLWEEIAALLEPVVPLPGGAFMAVEPTRALVAVDVNTGRDTTPAAALKANLAAVSALPRQLRLRGLGGQVIIDFAPLPKAERRRIEGALKAALRVDGIETTVAGWTPLGNLELHRKRARRPLADLRGQILVV